jgi:PHP family Zn ribbon phosphoesterase
MMGSHNYRERFYRRSRVAACPKCLGLILVDAEAARYRCPHCGVALEGAGEPTLVHEPDRDDGDTPADYSPMLDG